MHKMTAAIIIVIIFVSIGIVIFSTTNTPKESSTQQNLSDIQEFDQTQDEVQGLQQPPQNTQPTETSNDAASPSARYEQAVIETSKGTITLELYPDDAPMTVANFGKKAASGFYDELTFHRIEDWVAQGGDPEGDGTGGGQMSTELNERPFVEGSLGVARGGNIEVSNDAQFFITKTEADWLNGQYTNFGLVTEGMDVVNNLEIGDEIVSVSVE